MQSHLSTKEEPIITIAKIFARNLRKKLRGTQKGSIVFSLASSNVHCFCAFLKSLLILTKALEDKLDAEISQVDQKVVLELDQLVSDQQATLQVSQISYLYVVACLSVHTSA